MKNKINILATNATLNDNGEIYVTNRKVVCEGSLEYSKHPRIFLSIKTDTDKIKCPYCSQIFIYKANSND